MIKMQIKVFIHNFLLVYQSSEMVPVVGEMKRKSTLNILEQLEVFRL